MFIFVNVPSKSIRRNWINWIDSLSRRISSLYEEAALRRENCKDRKSADVTCGLYNASGKLAAFVGIPAKSGVSGGIVAAVPARNCKSKNPFPDGCGIGIYCPAIDSIGNSYAGTKLLQQLSREWELNIF